MPTDDKFYQSGYGKNDSTDEEPHHILRHITKTIDDESVLGALDPYDYDSSKLSVLGDPSQQPVGDAGPRGVVRFYDEVNRSGYSYGTEQYENFILRMKQDPTDSEYSWNVRQKQAQVKKDILARQKKEDETLFGTGTKVVDTTSERAGDVEHKRQSNIYIGSNTKFVDSGGSETTSDPASLGSSLKPGSQSGDMEGSDSDEDYSEVPDSLYIQAGGAVWVGDTTVQAGTETGTQAVYRNAADMMNDVYRWSPQQTAAFQKNLGLEPTGVADDKTVAAWKWAINTARYYTAMGQKRSVDSILQSAKSQISGGGGGGGGGGGATVPADAAKRLLNQAMKQFAGREATADELKAFLPAIRAVAGSSDFDAAQFTEDWVKGGSGGARSTEVGNYQAATDYYSVVQQLIGGA